MKLAKATTALAATMFAGAAFAADLPSRKAPVIVPPPPLLTWTGFHLGVNAGAVFGGSSTATTVGAPVLLNTATTATAGLAAVQNAIDASYSNIFGLGSRTRALLGVQAGYDYQFASSFVAGIEADVQGVLGSGWRGAFGNLQAVSGGLGTVQSNGIVQKRTDWLGTVRARLGYTITPTFLLYATGGLAVGGVKASTTVASTFTGTGAFAGTTLPNSGVYTGYSDNRIGYAVGGGGEWMFSPSFSLKLEYLYYNLGSASYAGVSNTSFGASTAIAGAAGGGLLTQDLIRTRVRYDGHIARVGLNYHFWGAPLAPVVARY